MKPLTGVAFLCAATLLIGSPPAAAAPPGSPAAAKQQGARRTSPDELSPDRSAAATGASRRPAPPAHPDQLTNPDSVLGAGWRTSPDRAVTTSGDETGLHILVADRAQAYRWRTAATLAEPGFDTDQWIGQLCVTGSGRRAVVVYAPRQFANKELFMQRGGFAAVVDLKTGAVTKLAERVSLAYHNPGCGAGEQAVLSRLELPTGNGPAHTWLGVVNTAKPAARPAAVRVPGQITSTVPVGNRLVGVKGANLVQVDRAGRTRVVAATAGTPFRLVAEGASGLAFQVVRGPNTDLSRLVAGKVSPGVQGAGSPLAGPAATGRRPQVETVASVPLGAVKLQAGAGGRVFAVGGRARTRVRGTLPRGWQAVDAPPDSSMSSTGALAVLRARTGREAAGRKAATPDDGFADRVEIEARPRGGKTQLFTVDPDLSRAGRQPSPAIGGPATTQTAPGRARALGTPADPNVPYDPDRGCAVPRNDPQLQVYQPTVEQVEWAADLAVRGLLTFQRPANWNNNGLPAFSPQGMFPSTALTGGGYVPAQIMLGILAQESNLWQASNHAVDVSAGNPLTSLGFYGIKWNNPDFDLIDWVHTDCGYGVAQVTSGMSAAETDQWVAGVQWDYTKQRAVAIDYATNVAAGLRILQDKWNITRGAGLIANDGNPAYLENWWFAIWAYNTGFYSLPPVSVPPDYPWGVGWANNPANTDYPPDRKRFLTAPLDVYDDNGNLIQDDSIGYDNAKHPNHWSYPERVIGFAYTSLIRYDYVEKEWLPTYTEASTYHPNEAQPTLYTFCRPDVNACDQNATPHQPADYPNTKPGACQRDDLKCWWHAPVTWTDCLANCGRENRRYTTVEPRPYAQAGDNIHPTPTNSDGTCKIDGLPSGSLIIDDITTTAKLGPSGCTPNFTRGGSFALNFATTTGVNGVPVTPGKVDLHQIGAGFGGHFWFTHTRQQAGNASLRATGTWTINPTGKWTRVFVHVPDHGAHTQQANYRIYRPGDTDATAKHRSIPTMLEANRWVDIGTFDFTGSGTPKVVLDNFTADGYGIQDIAWDAIAVQPLPAKPEHFIVAMGDSYSSGEGAGPYEAGTNQYNQDRYTDGSDWNACRRSAKAWSRVTTLPGASATLGELAAQHNQALDFHHLACSGAETENILRPGTTNASGDTATNEHGDWGQYGERTQIDRGYLDENTTLVLLSIGGNDAGFKEILPKCLLEEIHCEDTDPQGDRARVTNEARASVRQVMDQIGQEAPNAKIALMGYPRLFDEAVGCFTVYFTWDERAYLNDLADLLADNTVSAFDVYDPHARYKSIGIRVIDDFTSEKRVCAMLGEDDTSTQEFHGILVEADAGPLENNDGDPFDGANIESFHPNEWGYLHYGNILEERLLLWGYEW